ncbi:trimeric intracellular cation channel family protein [Caviibacter abscessus]|uniref:trimeric intracellular cation channel family protein n=1 Tax=Caviibacter abscessus TaxID=1766719 RepID=UPI000834F011|nr:trimeric intracellular cation channel family protein [Caviibacter abscessus]
MNEFITIANFIGVIAFAASGAFKGFKYKLDILGIIVLAVVTAVGGGIIRDTILNRIPFVLYRTQDIYVAIIVAVVLYLVTKKTDIENKYNAKLLILDAVGLSVFTIIGARVAISANMSIISIAIISTITGVGGGVLRDMLSNEIPIVLKEDIYAILCFFGSIFYVFFIKIINNEFISSTIIFCVILSIRIIVIKYKLNLPK